MKLTQRELDELIAEFDIPQLDPSLGPEAALWDQQETERVQRERESVVALLGEPYLSSLVAWRLGRRGT